MRAECKECGWVSPKDMTQKSAEWSLKVHNSRMHKTGKPERVKRPYTKRQKQVVALGVHFCPNCGFNLAVVQAALRMVQS